MDNSHTDVAFLVGPTGKIATWNSACQKLLGHLEQDVLQHPLLSLAMDGAGHEARLRHASEQQLELVLGVRRADGGELSCRLTLLPQFGKAGCFLNCIALLRPESASTPASETDEVGRTPLTTIMKAISAPCIVSNSKGQIVLWNQRGENVMRMSTQQLAASNLPALFNEQEWRRLLPGINEVLRNGKRLCVEAQMLSANGSETPHLISWTRLQHHGNCYLFTMAFDISERRQEQRKLLVRTRALHAISNGIVICACAGQDNLIEYANPAFERITGYALNEVIGRDSRFMAVPDLDKAERLQLRAAITERREINVVFRNRRKNGDIFWNDLSITPVCDELGDVSHFIGILNDVTAQKQHTAELEHEVNHDALTGLANRNLLSDRVDQALHAAQRNKSLVAIILLDLNKFKLINDTMGHDTGDEVLKAVAKRLQSSVRDTDTAARLSGDEFVLVLANQPSLRFTLRMIERVRNSLLKPVTVNGSEISVCGALGISVYPHDGSTSYDLIHAADTAMYQSKKIGKGEAYFFSPDMKSTTDAKRTLEDDMHAALDKKELFLLFQPRRSLVDTRITGIEALLRWNHPRQGVLLPSAFLDDAEENGLIVPLGAWVLDQVCQLLLKLRKLGRGSMQISINCSYREFSQAGFVDQVSDKLAQFKLLPGNLELDLSEKHLLCNPTLSKEVVRQMRRLGVMLAIDDFGAGTSNLGYLQDLPMHYLKMTRASVAAIDGAADSGPLARTLIDIGHSLHLAVVGEGVENLLQQDFLSRHGCDEIQGNFYQKPLTEERLWQLLRAKPAAPAVTAG